jgi:hypothetical protein
MKEFRILSEIDIICSPRRLYDFVTTPDNWVGTHPVTKGVRGNTASPRGLGERWFEVIEVPGRRQFETEWRVVKADPPRLWQIQADNVSGLPVTVTITYTIDERVREGLADAKSSLHFRRDMVSSLPWYLLLLVVVSKSLRDALTSSEVHDMYLKAVKDRIESQE